MTAAGLIAKLVVIERSFADLYERITKKPTALHDIEHIARSAPGAKAIDSTRSAAVGRSDPRL